MTDDYTPDEMAVLQMIADRLSLGRRSYGPLHIATDPRDWHREALEELLDATIYQAVAIVKCMQKS
jgi:hypothetical protein